MSASLGAGKGEYTLNEFVIGSLLVKPLSFRCLQDPCVSVGIRKGVVGGSFKYSKLNQTFKGMFPMKKEVRITVVGKVWNANFAQ